MFNDPKNELNALEGRMLAAEAQQEPAMLDEKEFEALYNEIRAEFAPRSAEPPIRNFANGYGKNYAPAAYAAPRPAPQYAPAPAPVPEPRKKRNVGLGFLIFLEIVALTAVLGFWALYLLG